MTLALALALLAAVALAYYWRSTALTARAELAEWHFTAAELDNRLTALIETPSKDSRA